MSPALGLAGTDEESVATWLPGSKEFNDARANLAKNGVDFGLIYVKAKKCSPSDLNPAPVAPPD